MPDLYAYSDSRQFLKDYYEEQKKSNPAFSYQYFANRAGIKSKTFIFKVIAGQKALSRNALFGLAHAMGLKKRETDYFEALVNFTQAKSERERQFYFGHLQAFGGSHAAVKLRQDQYEYFSKWYNPAIRELAAMLDFGDDFALLARLLDPPITARQAKTAVGLLCKNGLLRKNGNGRYCRTEKTLTTGDRVTSLAVQAFQKENLRLAAESVDRHPRERRDISTLTAGISKSGFRRIAEEIAAFRKKLACIIEADEPADRVYQINFQLFPLSNAKSDKVTK